MNVTNCVQTFHEPPSLRLHCSSLSTVSHPRAGTELHPGKGIPNQAMAHGQQERFCHGALSTNNLQSLIPHMPVPPKEVCTFSAQQSLGYTTSLPGLQQQAGPEVSGHRNCSLAPSGNRSTTILPLRELLTGLTTRFFNLTGLTTRFFNPAPTLTSYTDRNSHGYGFWYSEMNVRSYMTWKWKMVMESWLNDLQNEGKNFSPKMMV
jgi:hypothetical protein